MNNKNGIINLRNLDLEIIANVDDEYLQNLRLCNKYMASLCQDQELWRRKLGKIMSHDLIKFKISEISYSDYYNFSKMYPNYLYYLTILFGSEQLIDDMIKNFGVVKFIGSKKKIEDEIKKIIRRYPNSALSLSDKVILLYSFKYGMLDIKEIYYGYNMNEIDRALIDDGCNNTFEFMLHLNLNVNQKCLKILKNYNVDLDDKIKLLIKYDIKLPDNIYKLVIPDVDMMSLLLEAGYVPDQYYIDYAIRSSMLEWYTEKDIIPVIKFFDENCGKISQRAFNNFILSDYHIDEYSIIIEYLYESGLQLNSDILKQFLDTLYHELIHGYEGGRHRVIKYRLEHFFALIHIFERNDIKISHNIVNIAKHHRFNSVVKYLSKKYNIYPKKDTKVSSEIFHYESK